MIFLQMLFLITSRNQVKINLSMEKWIYFICVFLALASLQGCGEGYKVKSATLNLTEATDESKTELLVVVSRFLKKEEFEDLGKFNDMISLIEHGNMSENVKLEQVARLNREHSFLNDAKHLRIVLVDYVNLEPPKYAISYTPLSKHFIEINVFEERPGGFSVNGLNFYNRFLADLREHYGESIHVINEPPPTDETEYRRITLSNIITTIFGCSIAIFIPLIFTGFLSLYVLRKFGISEVTKRIIFILINTWLVAPMPFPAAMIVVPLPNLVAFPWLNNLDYYQKYAQFAAVSFPCSILVCTLFSFIMFKIESGRKNGQ